MKKTLLALLLVAVAIAGGALWWTTRTEPIPEELEEVEEEDRRAVEIPGLRGQAPLDLAALEGERVVFIVIGTWSARSPEGEATNRALSRWVLPEGTRGFVIADAGGMGLFAERIEKTMTSYAAEVRFPLYVDYDGVFVETFKLPKGHHGLVVLDEAGDILERHSGGLEGEALEDLREVLGAREPPPGPPMPPLKAGGLDLEACAGTTCALVFIGDDGVKRADIPGIRPGGFEGDDDARLAQMRVPAVRAVTLARKMKLASTRGAFIGDIDPEISSEGWERLDTEAGAQAREALGIGEDETALVVFDHGREAMRETGLIPLHAWGRLADLLGIEGFNDRRPPKG